MAFTQRGIVAFDLVAGAAGIAVIGLLALALRQPLLFPSLGPTIILVLLSPQAPSARPATALIGHYVGIAAALASLALTGLLQAPPVYQDGVAAPRVVAAGLSVGLTAAALRMVGRPHPPAGSTTLIVSLGLLTSPAELTAMVGSIAVLVALCVLIDRVRRSVLSPRARGADPQPDDAAASRGRPPG